MNAQKRFARLVVAAACVAAAACSTVLGLQPPPGGDAGVTGPATTSDATTADAIASDAGTGDGSTAADATSDAAQSPVVCAPLDREDDGGGLYSALAPSDDDAGPSPWSSFDTTQLAHRTGFAGGTFDGTYVYFAGRGTFIARYDTGLAFENVNAWSEFDVSTLGLPGGFEGAAFDGRYVYFVPYGSVTTRNGVVARYDTTGPFGCNASSASFDLTTLMPEASAPLTGFVGAGFDGRYVYFVPRNDGVPTSVVVRYDANPAEAGVALTSGIVRACDGGAIAASNASDGGDAGDAGGASDAGVGAADAGAGPATFGEPSQWQTFDLTSVNSTALGYSGAVFDGTGLTFVPAYNDVYGGALHGGNSGIAARLRTAGAFDAAASWTVFDLTTVNGLLTDFMGGAFDSRYVYLAPRASGIVPRYDTAGGFASTSAWSAYDMTRLFAADAGAPSYQGAAFDGRFVYFVPAGSGFNALTRYDTRSTFDADCAWSTIDLSQFALGDAGPGLYVGAVFDGQYLYLVPDGAYPVLRFLARTPPRQPMLPAYSGSFL